MKPLAMMLCVLLASCGYVPTESKLVGSWQVVMPAGAPQTVIFAFQKDHTYSMTLRGVPGVAQGTWRLDGEPHHHYHRNIRSVRNHEPHARGHIP